MVFKERVLVRVKGGKIDTYDAKLIVIPELALGANILTSSIDYVQQPSCEPSTLLYNLLIPRLKETLFELQRELTFPIDPAPFTGKFQVKETDSVEL